MAMKTFAVLLALAAASTNAFEISSMSAKEVKVKEGEPIELWCRSDDYWEWCEITHVPTDKSCEHVWQKTPAYNVVGGKCDDFEGRVEYIGDKGSSVYKCGVRIRDVRSEEAGQWRCDITSYYDGSNKWQSYGTKVSKTFEVDVEIKTTTTTTTTTPEPTTAEYTYDYPEKDPVEEDPENPGTPGSQTGNGGSNSGGGKRKGKSGLDMTYVIIIVVAVVVVCVLVVLGALHYKKKLPAAFGGAMAGKNFKPVDQNETAAEGGVAETAATAEDAAEEEAKHPSIVKANGSSNGVSPTKEAAEKKPSSDEAEINPDLTKVTWTSEKEKAEAEGEDKPLKGVEED